MVSQRRRSCRTQTVGSRRSQLQGKLACISAEMTRLANRFKDTMADLEELDCVVDESSSESEESTNSIVDRTEYLGGDRCIITTNHDGLGGKLCTVTRRTEKCVYLVVDGERTERLKNKGSLKLLARGVHNLGDEANKEEEAIYVPVPIDVKEEEEDSEEDLYCY